MGLFDFFKKQECSFCGNKVGVLGRDSLSNKTGFVCKECKLKCSPLVKVGSFTKDQLEEHMKYMEKQDVLFEKAFAELDKDKIEKFMCINTGLEFADDIAMFRYVSDKAKKYKYRELFRYDQIKSYEPYYVENTSTDSNGSSSGKKYSEVGITIKLNSNWAEFGPSPDHVESRQYHPYVYEIKVPTHRNVDDFSHIGLYDKLEKIFGRYEDTSVVGSIKSSFVGTNKERANIKAASEGLKALGNMAKAKITGNEEDAEKAKESMETFKDSALNLATENKMKYAKIADEVEERVWGKEG